MQNFQTQRASKRHLSVVILIRCAVYTQPLARLCPGPQPVARNCGRKFIPGTGISRPCTEYQAGTGGAREDLDKEREVEVGVVSRGRAPEGGGPGCRRGEESVSLD